MREYLWLFLVVAAFAGGIILGGTEAYLAKRAQCTCCPCKCCPACPGQDKAPSCPCCEPK
jgi:hypothetical protein